MQSATPDAISMLKQDHREVEGLFTQFEKASPGQKAQIIDKVCQALIIHSELEEKIFYPAARQASTEQILAEAQVEHDAAKVMILNLMETDDSDQFRNAKFKVLAEEIKHHIKEEEAPEGLLAKAQRASVNTRELTERMTQLKQQLQQKAEAGRLPEPRLVSLQVFGEHYGMESRMPMHRDEYVRFTDVDDRGYRGRGSNDRDRDDRGRFTSDDDGRGYPSRGANDRDRDSRGRFTDDDGRGYRSQGSNDRDRDSRGRFMSEDDGDRRYGSRGGGRGQGGWFGDPQGHSESSRRGWDERVSGSRSRSYREDDDDRSYRTSGGGRGWYGDPEGHSEASQRGWDEREGGSRARPYRGDDERSYRSGNGGRDHGGWFGDPEGHSEASRRGWDERGGRSEGRSYASRDRDYDDDRGSRSQGRGRDHGGWFGDSEGHAEAARRSWEDRR